MAEKYKVSRGCIINSNCDVTFNQTEKKDLHIKINTFDENEVVLTEETFLRVCDAYAKYKAMGVTNERKA